MRPDLLFQRLDEYLLAVPAWVKGVVYAITVAVIVGTSLPHVPKMYLDYASLPLVAGIEQPPTYGPDSLSDMYAAKVILNDWRDMYTRRQLEQTPLEASVWTKEEVAPYPPAVLLAEAGLYAIGEWTGLGFYGMILGLAIVFLTASAWYFLQTRWYLFPLLYLNFGYFSERFVYVQDDSYLVMLVVVMAALVAMRNRRETTSHLLMAVATVMKLSPLYYVRHLPAMRPVTRSAYVAVLLAGLVLPWFVWENYLYIFRFHEGAKGNVYDMIAAVFVSVPIALLLYRIEARGGFDREDWIGWSLVPLAVFLGMKMRVTRHLLLVLLIPDKRGTRNIVAAIGLALHALWPNVVLWGSVLYIDVALIIAVLVWRVRGARRLTRGCGKPSP